MAEAQIGPVDRHLSSAQQAEQSGDFAAAAREYREVLEQRPQWALILQKLGLTLHLQGFYSEAIPEFEKAIAIDPQLWGAHLFLGMDYYRVSEFNKAIPVLERSLELNPAMAESEARFWLGASHLALGHHEDAIRELRKLLQLKSSDIEALFHMAKAYDQYGSALFEQIGQQEPNSSLVFLLQAERMLSENRLAVARSWYIRAIAVRPDLQGSLPQLEQASADRKPEQLEMAAADIRANYELAQFYSARGDEEKAARHRQKLEHTQSAPKAVPAGKSTQEKWTRINAARSRIGAGDLPAAERELSRVERDIDTLYALGRLYKRWAAITLQRLIEVAPDSYRTHQLTGERHEDATEYPRALESYKAALARQPELAGIRYSIGNVYWKMRNYVEAERWLSEEVKRNPHHGLAHLRLGSIYVDMGKPDSAVTHLEETLRIRPELTAALLPLAQAYIAKQSFDHAITVLRRYEKADPANDRVHYLLANALRRVGRTQEADVEMQKFQELSRRRHEQVQADVRKLDESLPPHR
jgi:tetratricopeptide (TPR) repeat protein